jgi:hypothetical protein
MDVPPKRSTSADGSFPPGLGADRQAGREAAPSPPSISLPKGGGAVRGIGEKFAANPVTGTGTLSVQLATSPGRSGFGPTLTLEYDSGAGNGIFGFGWSVSLPSVTRKTDKGLPRYQADASSMAASTSCNAIGRGSRGSSPG